MIRHKICFVIAAVLLCNIVFAQTVDEGKKFLYYERFKSAKEVLEKVVASAPTNAEAAYWLGQVLIEMKDVPGAKAVYQKALQANGSNPMLLAGMGHIELLENKGNDARQRFETAISLTKAKDVQVLNAVGHANVDAKETGDPKYAIEKLNLATALKGMKEPAVYINLGDAYKNQADGGGAVTAYQNALTIDPKYAEAKYKIGKIYWTQGPTQASIFLQNWNDAVALDPAYAPAYHELATYWFFRDINKSKDYFFKYKANTDFTPSVEAEEISLIYGSGDFKGAIAKADEKIQKEGANADAKLFRVKGYAYDKLGDSIQALSSMEQFFAKAPQDQVMPDNYVKMAEISAKFPDKANQADDYFNKAIAADTLVANRVDYANAAVNMYKKTGNEPKIAEWYTRILTLKPTYSKSDLYYAGLEQFRAENFTVSDSLFNIYKTKYPTEYYGYYWCFRSKWAQDTTLEKGPAEQAIPDCTKFIELAEADKAKFTSQLKVAYGFMAGFSANVKKDYPTAIGWLDKLLEIDPTNIDVQNNKKLLQKAMQKPPAKSTTSKGGGAKPEPK
ncbi:MAG: hypothetical protein C5B52_05250 [Bacteroidetes bacterium]|nr:MAG: hypothetical protein C5B52_05250 [Bacteroidota bacterium]